MAFRTVDRRKEELPNWSWKADAIEAMQRFAEFRFTADGKLFALELDGEVIGHHMTANGNPDFKKVPHVWNELRAIAGAVVVCDDAYGFETDRNGKLLLYRDEAELLDAWRELHEISEVAMSEADAEHLAEYDEDDTE